MDYIAQLNGFWQWRRQYEISCQASMMYMALLHFAEQGQTSEVKVRSSDIQELLGVGKTAMYSCRKELEEAGLITFFKGNGGKTPVYCIKEFTEPSLATSTRSDVPSLAEGTSPDQPSLAGGTRSALPSLAGGTRSGENGVPSLATGTSSQVPTNMYINNNNNNSNSNNNTITTNTKILQIYTEQTDNEEQVNQKEGLYFFENNIRPIGSRFEGENLMTLISEFGVEAFKGAVLLAKKNSVNNGNTWRWMQTVLTNGDWKYGYEDRPKAKRKRVPRIPELDIVSLLGE